MAVVWGVHNDRPELDLIGQGCISVGWDHLGDLRGIGRDREDMKHAVASTYPGARPGAIPVWAGVLLRFAFELQPGDLVVYPDRRDRTLNFGRVAATTATTGRCPSIATAGT